MLGRFDEAGAAESEMAESGTNRMGGRTSV
jgi:hypothetical protein